MAWYHRLLNVVRPNPLSRDLDREMAAHLAERTDDLIAGGMTATDAAREARRRFGNVTAQRERTHDVDGLVWLETLIADVRYATRALRASPGFTAVAILSLALGIGANTAIFSLTNAVALKSLPVSHPEELVSLLAGKGHFFTNPLWEQLRDQPSVFAGALAYSSTDFNLNTGGEVHRASGDWVSGGFFAVLGVRPVAGRLLQPADDVRGCPPVAAVSDGFAQRKYGSAAESVGKTVSLDGHPFQVVGVVDPLFSGIEVGRPPDIYVPLCTLPIISGRPDVLDARSRWYLQIMARSKAGMTAAQLSARLAVLAPGIFAATLPGNWPTEMLGQYKKMALSAQPAAAGLSQLRDTYRAALLTLMVVVGVVLLIACANIANLLLARAAARQREIAIRLAIGAGRWRLVRQLLTESLLLAFGGAAVGIVFAHWATRLIVSFLSTGASPIWLDLSLDGRVLAFTIGVATLTGVLFGLAPAWWASHVDPQAAMKTGGRGVVGAGVPQRVGKVLVAGQVALSLVLVAAGALLLGSFHRLVTLDPGFRREGTVLMQMDFSGTGLKERQLIDVPSDMLRRIRETRGVTSASTSLMTPLGRMEWNDFVLVPGFKGQREDSLAFFNQVSDGYFATLGTPLLVGRDITADDIAEGRSVVVINETMARRFFGSTNALGRVFRSPMGDSTSPPREVVGVVGDTKYERLDESPQAIGYYPLGVSNPPGPLLTFEIRTPGSLAGVVRQVTSLAAATNPSISIETSMLATQLSESLARPRLLAALSGFFGALALLLAMIGLYGTIAYSVAQRHNEIGVRVALGAGRARVMRMVAGEAARLIVTGVIAGTLLALATTRLLSAFLFGVSPGDASTLVSAAMTLLVIGMAAALVPAWRAAKLDPMTALRTE